jgi:all-trans-retinol 13,14-reductase
VGVLEDLIAAFRALQPRDFTVPGPWSTTPADAASLRPSGDAGTGSAVALLERWGEVPAQALLDDHIRDQRVRDLLGSQGTSETSMPVVLLARMWDFMAARGIWYPVDGIGIAGEMLAARFSESGGDLRLGTEVIEILVKHGRAAGVRLRSGEEVRARLVISDADYRRTLLDLLPPAALSDSTTRVVAQQPLTASVFAVFLGVEAGGVDLGAFRGHQLLVKVEEGSAVPWPHKKPAPEDFATEELWLCWWSRHSARERLAPPGCEALVIKVMAPYAPFLRLDGGGRRRHAEEYYRVKERMADAVVATAERVVPGLAEATVVREVATPLTYRDWGHRSEGSVAGWSWRAGDVPEPWAQDLVTTPLPGLLSVGLQAYTRLFLGGLGTSLFSGGRAADLALAELVE